MCIQLCCSTRRLINKHSQDVGPSRNTTLCIETSRLFFFSNMTQYYRIFLTICLYLVSVSSFLIPDDDIEKKSLSQPRYHHKYKKSYKHPLLKHLYSVRSQKKTPYLKRNNIWTSLARHHLTKRGELSLFFPSLKLVVNVVYFLFQQ